jgi:hypothetical protein
MGACLRGVEGVGVGLGWRGAGCGQEERAGVLCVAGGAAESPGSAAARPLRRDRRHRGTPAPAPKGCCHCLLLRFKTALEQQLPPTPSLTIGGRSTVPSSASAHHGHGVPGTKVTACPAPGHGVPGRPWTPPRCTTTPRRPRAGATPPPTTTRTRRRRRRRGGSRWCRGRRRTCRTSPGKRARTAASGGAAACSSAAVPHAAAAM